MTDSIPTNEIKPSSRRATWGRRWLFVALPAVLLGGALGARAYAFGPGGHGRNFSPEQMEKMMDRRVEHLLDRVKATPDQRTKIQATVARLKPELKTLHDEHAKLHEAGQKALTSDPVNAGELERVRREAIQVADRTSSSISRALVEVASVLTPDQRKEVAQLMQEHHGRWGR